jgi:hypothetical protein
LLLCGIALRDVRLGWIAAVFCWLLMTTICGVWAKSKRRVGRCVDHEICV